MSDIIDDANDTAEFFLDLAKRNRKPVEIPKGNGECMSCSAKLDDDRRWCDTDCRTDWEREQARARA